MMKKALSLLLCVLSVVTTLCACSTTQKVTDEMFALDTFITFTVYDKDSTLAKETIDKCKSEITRLENLLSATKEGSDVYRINSLSGDSVQVSDETAQLIRKALEVSKSCDGAFDISVYPLVKLWGFDTKDYSVPTKAEIDKARALVDYRNITVTDENEVILKEGMSIDLGAIAKGYVADCVCALLKDSTVYSAIVNLGGTVVTYGAGKSEKEPGFTVGVEYPDTSGEVFLTFNCSDIAVVTSGDYQRFFEEDGVRYHHIIDSLTGCPAQSDISSVTVLGADASVCDALSTAFFVMGIDKTLEYIENHSVETENCYSYLILSKDKNELYASADFALSGLELEKAYEDNIEIHLYDVMYL